MRVLLDTNLIIPREDYETPPEELAGLFRILGENGVWIGVHSIVQAELEGDSDADRRRVILGKLATYPILESPSEPSSEFKLQTHEGKGSHDARDTHLLWALRSNAVNFLVTEDKGLLARATFVGLGDRALDLVAATRYFAGVFGRAEPPSPEYLKVVPMHTVDLADSFFDSFRFDYDGFDHWFAEKARGGRYCAVVRDGQERLGAICILKEEDEPIGELPRSQRLKICSFKVGENLRGLRLSERLLAYAFGYGWRNSLPECFATVFPKHQDLVALFSSFGFRPAGQTLLGEVVLAKPLTTPAAQPASPSISESFRYFPALLDGPGVRKFLVPVRPEWHFRLFPEFDPDAAQRKLEYYGGGDALHRLSPAGNAIKKAYLCHSPTRRVRPGDLLLFYRSQDVRRVTHLGAAEEVRVCRTQEEVVDLVGNRTVLPKQVLEELCSETVLALLFWDAGAVTAREPTGTALGEGVSSPPQSIIEVPDETYRRLCGARRVEM
ncbi:MAG TPA: GNAT family N-acetyltransferase [Thermoplasmata archaeon]|nr:GNAT family N-acetyltransferase [Thermoplasmata archaeon]